METFYLPFPGVKSNLISFNSFLAFLCNKKDNSWWNTAKKKNKTKQNQKSWTYIVWRSNRFSAFQLHVSLSRRRWRNVDITLKKYIFWSDAQLCYTLMNINWTTRNTSTEQLVPLGALKERGSYRLILAKSRRKEVAIKLREEKQPTTT